MKSLTGSKGALGSKVGSKLEITGSKAASQMLVDSSQHNIEEADDETSSMSSDDDSEHSEDDPAAGGVENKLQAIKDSEVEDPSILKLTNVLNLSFGFVVTLLITAFIACNAVRNTNLHFVFIDKVSNTGLLFNDILADARLHYFQQINTRILDVMNANQATKNYLSCSLAENDTRLPMCDFMRKFHGVERIRENFDKLLEDQRWITTNYQGLRLPGDPLDKAYATDMVLLESNKGADVSPENVTIPTFADFVAKILDSIDKVGKDGVDLWDNGDARMDYLFLESNRYLLSTIIGNLIAGTFESMKEIIATEVLLHLILMIIMILGLAVSFGFLIPRIREVQAERLLILKLLLLVPKHLVWDFVYTIYRDAEEEDEENGGVSDFDDDGKTGADAKNAAKAKAMKMRSEDTVEIVNDNVYSLHYFFGLLTASIAVPLIIHVAWRYSFNAEWSVKLDSFNDLLALNINLNALTWRSIGLIAPCEIRPPRDQNICISMASAASSIRSSADSSSHKYYTVQRNFNGDQKLEAVLYNVDQNVEILPTCQTGNTINVKIWKPLSSYPQIVYPSGVDTSKDSYLAEAKDSRCRDTFKSTNSTPFDLRLPADYSIKSTHGVGQLIANALQSAFVLGQTPGWDPKNQAVFGPLSTQDVWYNLEAPPFEGAEGMNEVAGQIEKKLLEEYSGSKTAFNVTYAVTLVYACVLYLMVFRSVKKDLSGEFKHNRGILFMVPMQIVAKSKPIIEYVERVFQEVTSV
jgi:hypothetical protein